MDQTSQKPRGAESSSESTPEKKDSQLSEESSTSTKKRTSHIVDLTDEFLKNSESIIIIGGPKPPLKAKK